jgi:membrane protein
VEARSAIRGALAAAIGFEILKWLGNLYLEAVGRSPIGVTFGWLVGLLVFVYLVARMLMLVAAWTAVGRTPPNRPTEPEPPAVPSPTSSPVPSPQVEYPADVPETELPEPARR